MQDVTEQRELQTHVLLHVQQENILQEELLLVVMYKRDVTELKEQQRFVLMNVQQGCILLRVLLLVLLVNHILLIMESILQMEPLHSDVHLNVMQDIKQEQIEIVLVRV